MSGTFYLKLRSILSENGCTFVRQGKGSHEIWYSSISGKNVTVPVTIVSKVLANIILKQAGITNQRI